MIDSIDNHVDRRLRELIVQSGIPLKDFSAAAGASTSEVLNWWSRNGGQLSSKNLRSLSLFFGVSEERLADIHEDLPVSLIRDRLFQGPRVLPEAYGHHAGSFVRSSAHIVEFLALTRGRRFADSLLTSMDVHPLIFDDLDNRINFQFLIDILNRLNGLGMSDSEIEALGNYVFLRIQDTELGRKLADAQTYRDSYELLGKYLETFDTNFNYRMDVDAQEMRLYATPTEAERFLAGRNPRVYQLVFRQKRRLTAWLPTLSGLAPANLDMPMCVTRGDKYCLYRFKFAHGDNQRPHVLRLLRNS